MSRRTLMWLWGALVSGYFLWEAGHYRGIYGMLAEWQIAWFGWYIPILTFGIPALCLILPVTFLLRRRRKTAERDRGRGRVRRSGVASRIDVLVMHALYAGTAILGVCTAFALIFAIFFLPNQDGLPTTVVLGETSPAKLTEGPTRLVGGTSGEIAIFKKAWMIDRYDIAYTPLLIGPHGDQNVQFFSETDPPKQPGKAFPANAPVRTGILVKGGMPGTMRALYEGLGYRIGKPYYTLYASKQSLAFPYFLQVVELALFTLLFGIFAWFQRRHVKKQEQKPADTPAEASATT